ncbi:hypothetical protein NQ318_018383, partial [Aromia moschata]
TEVVAKRAARYPYKYIYVKTLASEAIDRRWVVYEGQYVTINSVGTSFEICVFINIRLKDYYHGPVDGLE